MLEYKALYRRFRPLNFLDVVGQEHISNTLKNQIQNNTIIHRFLKKAKRQYNIAINELTEYKNSLGGKN